MFGNKGSVMLEFQNPQGIHAEENCIKIVVANGCNPCIQVIDTELTFSHSWQELIVVEFGRQAMKAEINVCPVK